MARDNKIDGTPKNVPSDLPFDDPFDASEIDPKQLQIEEGRYLEYLMLLNAQ